MTVAVRDASTDEADLAALARLVNAVTPDDPTSVEEMRWADRTYPGTARFLAEEAGTIVGAATVGRVHVYPPDFDGRWATIAVLAGARRRGIGGALWAAVSGPARFLGKTTLLVPASEACPEGIAFLLRRGFREWERQKAVQLDLAAIRPPAADPAPGISIVSLAERPDLVPGVHAVAQEAFPDVPGGEAPMAAGSLEEFRARDVDRPAVPGGGFRIAVEDATGAVIGYASLLVAPGSRTVASHDMTAVLRRWRGRGVAAALKRSTIAWAVAAGFETLLAENDEHNRPMRALNERLGYAPSPDRVVLRGPLAPAGTARPG